MKDFGGLRIKNCSECPFLRYIKRKGYCFYGNINNGVVFHLFFPDWCPLSDYNEPVLTDEEEQAAYDADCH